MKESLFEMLLHLFEQTLTQLKETHQAEQMNEPVAQFQESSVPLPRDETEYGVTAPAAQLLKKANAHSMRVFTPDEQMKLTKTSYQFLMRLLAWGVISAESLELVMNQLILSDSPFVGLHETKWAIRNVLAESLSARELIFLDMVLYQQEDRLSLH